VQPKFDLAAIDQALGDQRAAHAELESAVRLQPDNPATWQQLGSYYLVVDRPRAALIVLQKASALYQGSPEITSSIDCAHQEQHGSTSCARGSA
jgi:cytochrome c-type biogenesis protein CcmH/NrfG